MAIQAPQAEIAERVAEAAPGLVVAAHLAAMDNWRRESLAYRQRVADSHRHQAEALGMSASKPPEETDVGNLTVTGDIYGANAAEIIRALEGSSQPPGGPPPPLPSTSPAKPSTFAKIAQAAIVAASLLGGAGIGAAVPWLAGAYERVTHTTTTVVQPKDDVGLGIEVIPGGAARTLTK